MNIIIPYRYEPSEVELKYSLRSIEKYLAGWDDLYLIGDKVPDWFKGNVIYYREEGKKLPRNILYKIQSSFAQGGNKVLQWQDDIYLTRLLDISDIKYWYEGTLEQAMMRIHGRYKGMIENTAHLIGNQAKYFDLHVPIIYEKHCFESLVNSYKWDQKSYIIKSLYCHQTKQEGEHFKNVKINDPVKSIAEIVGDSLFFSTGPQGVCPDMIEYLEKKYPDKSRFE